MPAIVRALSEMQTRIMLALVVVFVFSDLSFGQTQQPPELKNTPQLEGLLPNHVPAGEITKPGVITQPGFRSFPELPQPGYGGPVARNGTGFFVTNDGYLVTNNHVVESATEIVVFLADGRRLQGRIVTTDPENDLALVKVETTSRPLTIRDTRHLSVGEDVFTVGYPLPPLQGLDQKATFGRVNALSGIQGNIRQFQIDVPLQPGNSGGPLIDSKGRVVGIVHARLNPLVAQNVNYAVKADYLIAVLSAYTQASWHRSVDTGRTQDLPSLVRAVKPSVVLVLVK
ncbi:MAG TPA: trypsin-like peptidase domain-containing protein [Candidatus Binatia bacterium]|nr:trypsin-like peptidase domain-containing protein [Candidatus Binatia bacterium]